jgi:YD repeat-containing protein
LTDREQAVCEDASAWLKRLHNEFGDVTQEDRHPHEAQVKLFEQHNWATRYTYRYDDRGNWTEKDHRDRPSS